MKTLYEVIRMLPVTIIPNEDLMYSFSDLKKVLSSSERVYVGNECITPFYACGGKRMEFYYGTLSIRLVDKYDFDGHLLRLTGKKSISGIPNEIISLQKQCYIEVLREAPILSSTRILQYIEYVVSMPDIIDSVIRSFSAYDQSKMLFTFFHGE